MKSLSVAAIFALLVLGACEEPRRTVPEPPASTEETTPSSEEGGDAPVTTPDSATPPRAASTATVASSPEVSKEPELPEFEISREGERIVVSGALRSPLQVERILSDLGREFPDLKVESDLKVEYHRVAVGWPNRVSAVFLIDYLQSIESPRVAYRGGTVVLEGRAPDAKTHRELSEIAVETFADASTVNLENRIVVVGEGEKGGKDAAKGKGKGKGKAAGPAVGEAVGSPDSEVL